METTFCIMIMSFLLGVKVHELMYVHAVERKDKLIESLRKENEALKDVK